MKILILWLAMCASSLAASLSITWDPNAPEDSVVQYRIYQAAGSGSFTIIGNVSPPTVAFTIGNLASGTTYRHYVTAINSIAESAPSNVLTNLIAAPPAAPKNLRATAMSSTRIDLNWEDPADNESGFRIARKDWNGTDFKQIATIGPNMTSFIDSWQIKPGKTFSYYVAAYNSFGAASSGVSSATTFKR